MTMNLNRLRSTLKMDLKLELNYGFYHATAIVTAIWLIILLQLNAEILYPFFPFFVLSNMTITSFYFMAAMVLFEKNEGTINNLAVTPITFGEYLSSKIISLSFIAVTESFLIIAVVFREFKMNFIFVILGLFLLSLVNSLLGFIAISGYDTITDFFIPSIGWLSLLSVPVAWYLRSIDGAFRQIEWIYYIFPSMGPFRIITAGFISTSYIEVLFSLVMSGVFVYFLFLVAKSRYNTRIVRRTV